MKKYLVCILMLIVSCMTGCQNKETVAVPELLEPVEVQIATTKAEVGDMFKVFTYSGEVVPYVEEISFEVDGTLDSIDVLIGEEVKEGQVLASLDVEALEERIKDLREQIAAIEKEGSFSDRKARLDIEIAKEELEIMIIGTSTEEACTAKEIAIEKMEMQLLQAQQLRQLEVEKLNKLLAENTAKLNGTTITAPCDGQIIFIDELAEGSSVGAHTTVMCIADRERMSIQTEYIAPITVQNADMINARIMNKDYKVTYVPCEDSEYVSLLLSGAEVKTQFTLDQGTDGIECGQFATVMVLSSYKENVLTIPVNALFRDSNGRYVYLIEDGKQVRRDVETGLINDVEAEILSGLQEGDVVYVKE